MESNKTKITVTLENGKVIDAVSIMFDYNPNGFKVDFINNNTFKIPYRYNCGILFANTNTAKLDKILHVDILCNHGASSRFSDILVSHVGINTLSFYAKYKIPITDMNHESNVNHNKGKIYNPYTNRWSWL